MRTFFNRPPWANRGEKDPPSDFYRRAGQTYGDIVAANKEARERTANCAPTTPTEDVEVCKRLPTAREHSPEFEMNPVLPDSGRVMSDQGPLSTTRVDPYHVPSEDDKKGSTSSRRQYNLDVGVDDVSATAHEPSHDRAGFWKPLTPHLSYHTTEPDSTDKLFAIESKQGFDGDATFQADIHGNDMCGDVTVQILISSRLANTQPIVIHRKLSQSLKDVRLAWCKHQNLPQGMHSSVFLSWKGRRLFDVTTCRSLGIYAKRDMQRVITDDYRTEKDSIRIHMEAVIEEDFTPGSQQALFTHLEGEEHLEDDKPRCLPIKIALKCPGRETYTMNVSAQMGVSQVVAIYRDAQRVDECQDVYLIFDGDRLDPNSCLTDYDITHEDLVDVIIK